MKEMKSIEDWINELLNKLNVEYEAEVIPLRVEIFSEQYQCFGNVSKKIAQDGGKAHSGWLIHTGSNFIIEAERHIVWENDMSELIDITPQESDVENVLFVSDNVDDINTCRDVDNVRINKTDNGLVDDFIKICETLTTITSLGDRMDDYQVAIDNDIAPYVAKYGVLKNYVYEFTSVALFLKYSSFTF